MTELSMSFAPAHRNDRSRHRKSLGSRVFAALLRECGPSVKHVAIATGITPRTLTNWRDEQCDPTAEHLKICARFDAVWMEMKAEFGRANDESDAERLLAELANRLKDRSNRDGVGKKQVHQAP
jgi:hypothetical protein